MAEMMNAVRVHHYGGPEVLAYESIPRPQPAAGELLIRVEAAGVNPIDCGMRGGLYERLLSDDPFPLIVGWDVAGVIEAGDTAGTGLAVGDTVYALAAFPKLASAYAEYVVAPASDFARKPETLDFVQAAAVPLAALTAWQVVYDAAALDAGQRVLIHAAAGGVGHFAVQLAKLRGAYVIGTASPNNKDFLEGLGLDELIDYNITNFEDVARDIDVQLESFGGDFRARCWGVMKKDGILISIKGEVPQEDARAHGVRATNVRVRPNAGQLGEIAKLIDSGRLKVAVDSVYDLADAAKAQAHVEGKHTRGKVVLRIPH